jgi:hypothetical protein
MAAAFRPTLAAVLWLSAGATVASAFEAPPPPDTLWATGGIAIAPSDHAQRSPEIVGDDLGGVYICWVDERFGRQSMFAEYVDRFGASRWAPGGLALAGEDRGFDPSISITLGGRAAISWQTGYSVRFAPLTSQGPATVMDDLAMPISTRVRPDRSERPASAGKVPQAHLPSLLPDGAGGSWLLVEVDALSSNTIKVKRVDAEGHLLPEWPSNGANPGAGWNDEIGPVMCSDGRDGVIVAWTWWQYGMGAQRITGSGSLVEGWPATFGAMIDTVRSDRQAAGIVPDGTGGALLVWGDYRDPAREQLYAQHLNSTGAIAAGWPADGLPICSHPTTAGVTRDDDMGPRYYSSITADGAGGFYVAWTDGRADAGDIYLQRVTPDGIAPGWPEDGRALCAAPGAQSAPVVIADGEGGVLVAWEDRRDGGADVYVQRIARDGAPAPGWSEAGVALCVDPGDQVGPRIASHGIGGAVVAWEDRRGSVPLIYAAMVSETGWALDAISLESSGVTSTVARFVWRGGALRTNGAVVERSDESLVWQGIATLSPDPEGRLRFEDTSIAPLRRYGYRLRLGPPESPTIAGTTWIDVPPVRQVRVQRRPPPIPRVTGEPAEATLDVPAIAIHGTIELGFTLRDGSQARLDLIDLAGRRVATHPAGTLGAGRHSIRLGRKHGLTPGIYFARLVHPGGSITRRLVVLR